jgi:hypothetical protein
MGSLRELDLHVDNLNLDEYAQKSAILLADIAERSPHLSKLDSTFFDDTDFCSHFLHALSKRKPISLVLGKLTLSQFPFFCWPDVIRTNELTLIGPLEETFVSKICANIDARHLLDLDFDGVLPSCIYPVVEALGPSLRDLGIKTSNNSLDRRELQTLNLYRVLALTRRLETFDFAIPLRLTGSNANYDLGVQHFKNMTEFKVTFASKINTFKCRNSHSGGNLEFEWKPIGADETNLQIVSSRS